MLYNHHNRRLLFVPLLLLMMVFMIRTPSPAANNFSNPKVSNGISTWDCIWFGHYKQAKDDHGVFNDQPLKWRVLNVSGNEAMLLSDMIISANKYERTDLKSVFWNDSTIRTYMNGTMKSLMLTDEEISAVKGEIELPSSSIMRNPSYGFSNGYDASETRSAKKQSMLLKIQNISKENTG